MPREWAHRKEISLWGSEFTCMMNPRWERWFLPLIPCPGTFWVDDFPLYIIRFCLQSRGTIQFQCEVERTQKLETLEKDRFFRAVALHHDTLTHLWLTWRLFVVHGLEIGVVGFKCFIFNPIWRNDPIWRAYFSNGLVQLPTRDVYILLRTICIFFKYSEYGHWPAAFTGYPSQP